MVLESPVLSAQPFFLFMQALLWLVVFYCSFVFILFDACMETSCLDFEVVDESVLICVLFLFGFLFIYYFCVCFWGFM